MKITHSMVVSAFLISCTFCIFIASCGPSDFFIGGRCEVDGDCHSWSQSADGTVCVSGQCVCADPSKVVDCVPGEEPCHLACIPAECSELCLTLPPADWSVPVLVWMGGPDVAPSCPDFAPLRRYQGYANPSGGAMDCPACACEAAATSCALPTQWTAHTAACNVPGGSTVPFGAPAGWDGSCTSSGAIAGGMASLSVPAPVVTVGSCNAKAGVIPPPPSTAWGKTALACEAPANGRCDTGFCVVPPPDPSWQVCVLREGDRQCPEGYPTRSVFYETIDDARACTPCSCGAPGGADCSVYATFWPNNACSGMPVGSITVTSQQDACLDLPPNMGLGSKTAEIVSVTPASCAPAGGVPTGEIVPAGPTTLCCTD